MLKERLSAHFRAGRNHKLRAALKDAPRKDAKLHILDLGGRTAYWRGVGYDFLVDLNAHVTIQNLHESEYIPDPAAPEDLFDWTANDACSLRYEDNAFDFCHSNSVIEHVGVWRHMEAFAHETRRVAPSHYVQTPNFWFPIEPHFWAFPMNHWLPRPIRAELMQRMKLATAGRADNIGLASSFVDSARLLTRGQMRFLFPDSILTSEKVAMLAKSWIATRIAGQPLERDDATHG